MKKIRKFLFFAVIFLSCTGTGHINAPYFRMDGRIVANAAQNSLNKTAITISKGERFSLAIKGDYKKAIWRVDDKKVATVSENGVVKGVSAGNAVVSVEVDGTKYQCKVTVEAPYLNKTKLTVGLCDTFQLKVSGTKRKVSYKSADTDVVKVSSKGRLTFLKPGNTTVTAAIGGTKLTCAIRVGRPSIFIPDLVPGQEAAIDLSGKTYKNISFQSSAPEVVFVDEEGRMLANRPGNAQITVKIADYEYKRKIEVKNSLPAAAASGEYGGLDAQDGIVAKKAHEVLGSLVGGKMEEIEKILALHDYIVLNTAYDTSYTRYSIKNTLIDGLAVCQGYAETMKLFLDALGVENQLIYGMAGGDRHVWNLVCLDGDWYHLDVTWDDPLLDGKDVPGEVSYGYFMVPDEVMAKDHQWEQGDYPEAAGGTYTGYIWEKLEIEAEAAGLLARTKQEFSDIVLEAAREGRNEVTVFCTGDVDEDEFVFFVLNELARENPDREVSVSYWVKAVGEAAQFHVEMEFR